MKSQIREATLEKDAVRLAVVRGIVATITNDLIEKGRTPEGELTDEEVIAVIRRQMRQRKDSIEQFRRGGREDLASAEEAELKVLEAYLPQQLSASEIREVVERKIQELHATDRTKMGLVIGAVVKELKGRAGGALVKAVVEELLH